MNDKILSKIINIVKNLQEEGIPTNNVSGGKIAGTVEAGDDPPAKKKKKKRYIYQKGLRKIWQPKNGREN